jgi:hypothetical protein
MLKRGSSTLLAALAATATLAALSVGTAQAARTLPAAHQPAPAGSATTKMYWPSLVLSRYINIKPGQSLTLTGEGYAPNSKITFYQCNEGSLGSPEGIINSKTCDLKNTVTGTTGATGVVSVTIKVDPNGNVSHKSALLAYIGHSSCPTKCWGWGLGRPPSTIATLVASPDETWQSRQTVKVTGYQVPVPAPGSPADYLEECNPNVLSGDANACDTADASTISVNTNGRAKGQISVVTGTVGDGTCGSGSGNFEVCYLVVGNASGIVTTTPIDFYK